MFILYKVSNTVNDKLYIGLTKTSLAKRRERHQILASYLYAHPSKKCPKFLEALVEVGRHNFIWEEIYCTDSKAHAVEMEYHFIREHDSVMNGYNTYGGGYTNPGLCGEKNGMYGKHHTEAVKERLRHLAKDRDNSGPNNPMYGKKRSDLSTKNKLPKQWITKDGIDKQILIEESAQYVANGWTVGRALVRGQKKQRLKCLGCDTIVQNTRNKFCCRRCANQTKSVSSQHPSLPSLS